MTTKILGAVIIALSLISISQDAPDIANPPAVEATQ